MMLHAGPGHYEPPVATQPVFEKNSTQSLERSLGDGGTLGTWGYDLVHVSQENPAPNPAGDRLRPDRVYC